MSSDAPTFQNALRLHEQGQLDQAAALYQQILHAQPEHAEALHFSGVLARQRGRPQEAVRLIRQALKLQPQQAIAHCNLGFALHDAGEFEQALTEYTAALQIEPRMAAAFNNQALTLQRLGRYEEALKSVEQALALQPQFANAWYNQGNILRQLQRYAPALHSYEKALQLAPNFVAALNQRGSLLRMFKQLDEALLTYDVALQLRPDHVMSLNNRGNVLRDLDRPEDALKNYETALRLQPNLADVHGNLAGALQELHRFPEALQRYAHALSLAPQDPQLHWDESICRLLTGDFAEGWAKYESRWQQPGAFQAPHLRFKQPLWLGQTSLRGKTILLHAEQGQGDTLQFCRYAPLLAAQGATVLLQVQASLKTLLQGLEGVQAVYSREDALPDFDWQCPFLSLPLAFKTRLDTIPAPAVYLHAPAEHTARWTPKLGSATHPRIGLAWSGSPTHQNDRRRSIALADFIPHLATLPVEWISLQQQVRPEDEATLKDFPQLTHFAHEFEDFADTAAVISQLDGVVCVDTAVAHLAAAMGKPVWLLLPYTPDWRWLLDRPDSPWYPSMRLWRQTHRAQWQPVLQALANNITLTFP